MRETRLNESMYSVSDRKVSFRGQGVQQRSLCESFFGARSEAMMSVPTMIMLEHMGLVDMKPNFYYLLCHLDSSH